MHNKLEAAAALAAVEAYLETEPNQEKLKPPSQWRRNGRAALMRGGALGKRQEFRPPRSTRRV